MIVLDNTDVIEGGAATDAVVEYTFHGLVGSVLTQLAAGVMNTTLTTALYTASDIVVVTSIILVNTHSAAVAVTLRLDPANVGSPRYIIPKTISLGIGYSLHTDGVKITVMNASGAIVTTGAVSDTAYNATSWDGVTDIAPSKNAVRDKFESLTTIATDTGWVAAGDLWQGTGNDAGEVLSIGAAYQVPAVNAGGTKLAYVDGETPWADYGGTSTIVGSADWDNSKLIYYKKIGKVVFIIFYLDCSTSNNTACSFTVPYTTSNTVNLRVNLGRGYDNVTDLGANAQLSVNDTVVNLYTTFTGNGAWTSGVRRIVMGSFFYVAA